MGLGNFLWVLGTVDGEVVLEATLLTVETLCEASISSMQLSQA